jgi:hypothetical protein
MILEDARIEDARDGLAIGVRAMADVRKILASI